MKVTKVNQNFSLELGSECKIALNNKGSIVDRLYRVLHCAKVDAYLSMNKVEVDDNGTIFVVKEYFNNDGKAELSFEWDE